MAVTLLVAPGALAQSSHGAIGVSATILARPLAPPSPQVSLEVTSSGGMVVRIGSPAPLTSPARAPFIRVAGTERGRAIRDTVAEAVFHPAWAELRLPSASTDVSLRVERLLLSGT